MSDKQLYEDIGYMKRTLEFIVKYFEKNGLVEQVRENKTSIRWLRYFLLAILVFILKIALE